MKKDNTHIYVGFVKSVIDSKFSGRLRVWIPELGSREADSESWILCHYCSPFGGSTSWRSNSDTEFDTYEKTQSSYGFWAVPPDLDNEVIVLVPSGDLTRAVWIGSIFKDFMNFSVPGLGISEKNKNKNGKALPVTEYNKHDKSSDTSVPTHAVRPWHKYKAEGIGNLGLIKDRKRGIINSSSMRESPSSVYGWSTPGPKHPTTKGARKGGHSFVMDDGDGTEYIMLRTRSGGMVKIDETNGFIYAITPTGNSWVQMDADGNVDFFGAKSFSVRSREDINLKSDRNINIEAGQNINIKAAKNTTEDSLEYTDNIDDGFGGNISIVAMANMHTIVQESKFENIITGNSNLRIEEGELRQFVKTDTYIENEGNLRVDVAGDIIISSDSNTRMYSSNFYFSTENQESSSGSPIGEFSIIAKKSSLTSDNLLWDKNGKLSVGDTIYSVGDIYSAKDVSSEKQSLNALYGHVHAYIDTQPNGTGVRKDTETFGEGPTTTTTSNLYSTDDPIDVVVPDDAVDIPVLSKSDVLSSFPKTTIKTNGGKTVEIPDWWNRDTISVETITARMMTFEPCPEHFDSEDGD